MGKNPSMKDYAGNCYVTGKRKRTKIGSGKTQTFRCLDCGVMRHVSRLERNRAARPRCLACGGPIEMTMAEEKRTLGTKKSVERSRSEIKPPQNR